MKNIRVFNPILLSSLEFILALVLGSGPLFSQVQKGTSPYKVGNGVKEPVALIQPLPPYSEEARQTGIEGNVVLQAIVRKDGTVTNFKVLKGLGYGLDESAIDTIATKWRFKPGTLNGIPVDVIANIEVRFRLGLSEAQKAILKEYPLHAEILETHFNRYAYGVSGSGYANLKEGNSTRGFDWTCQCDHPFNPSQGGRTYPAKWKKSESRLKILTFEIGNPQKHKECELKVTMTNLVYGTKDGHLTTYTMEQWKEIQGTSKKLAAMPQKATVPANSSIASSSAPQSATPETANVKSKKKLTNSDVISMVNSGLSNDVILTKIGNSQCAFDTSPEALKQLATAKVPDKVLIEMIKRSETN